MKGEAALSAAGVILLPFLDWKEKLLMVAPEAKGTDNKRSRRETGEERTREEKRGSETKREDMM